MKLIHFPQQLNQGWINCFYYAQPQTHYITDPIDSQRHCSSNNACNRLYKQSILCDGGNFWQRLCHVSAVILHLLVTCWLLRNAIYYAEFDDRVIFIRCDFCEHTSLTVQIGANTMFAKWFALGWRWQAALFDYLLYFLPRIF